MNEPIIILQTCAILLALWVFWQYGWKVYALDRFRQSLFSVRGDLFEMVMKGDSGLDFTDPKYIRLRQFFEWKNTLCLIRVSFSQLVIGFVIVRDTENGNSQGHEGI